MAPAAWQRPVLTEPLQDRRPPSPRPSQPLWPCQPAAASSVGRRRPRPQPRPRLLAASAGLRRATLLCLLGGSMPWSLEAISVNVNIDASHPKTLFFHSVGLEPGAEVTVDLQSDSPSNDVYVILLTHWQWVAWHFLPRSDSEASGGRNTYLISCWRRSLDRQVKAKFKISAPSADRYYMGVLNAHGKVFDLRGFVSLVNPGGRQLPLQQEGVRDVLGFISVLFLSSGGVFVLYLFACKEKRDRTVMHHMMGVGLVSKGIVLLFWLMALHTTATSGDTNGWTTQVWFFLDKVQNSLEWTMFLLIAMGWKFLRPHITKAQIKFVCITGFFSFFLAVFESLRIMMYVVDLLQPPLEFIQYIAVLIALTFSLQPVHQGILDAPASLNSGALYPKLKAYYGFRIVFFVSVVLAPAAELALKITVMRWTTEWLYVLLAELRTWVIYMSIIVMFSPLPRPAHLRVFDLTLALDGGLSDDLDEEAVMQD